MKLNNLLNNINLKKVVPIALITIVVLVVTISLTICGKKDNKAKNKDKEVETNNTVKETKDNNESNGSIFDYLDEDYTSDDKNSSTAGDNQTEGSNTTGSTANNEQSTNKPSSSDKTTSSNTTTTRPIQNQTTTNNNSGNNNNNSNNNNNNSNNNNNQQQTDNDIVEVGYGLYDVEEEIREDAENFYCRTVEYYAWYEKYADGTVNMNKDRDYMLPQYMGTFTYATRNYEYGVLYEISIDDLFYYKYEGAYKGPTNAKAKELYNKYYRDEFATKEVQDNDDYEIYCRYYVDKKSNKAFRDYNELVMERVASDAVESLGTTSSSMSKEKKICLISNYVNSNTSIKDATERATTIVNALNKSDVKAYLAELKSDNSAVVLVQMEDGLWYYTYLVSEYGKEPKFLALNYITSNELKTVPNGAVFATNDTSRLNFGEAYGEDDIYSHWILISDITY